jgi:hypothetical protein
VGWVVKATPRPLYPRRGYPIPIVQELGWSPGSVWTNAKKLAPTGIRPPDRSARSQSLYKLRYNVAKKRLEKYRIEMFSVSKTNTKFYVFQSDIFHSSTIAQPFGSWLSRNSGQRLVPSNGPKRVGGTSSFWNTGLANIQHLTRVTLTTLLFHRVLNQSVSRVAITKTVSFTVLSTMFRKLTYLLHGAESFLRS